ncbi:hypothetical protein G6F57_019028 [Rhizopus arrhizus]|nr:hypothetical protein G6F57_019028 [Rhizopus arrhizus]
MRKWCHGCPRGPRAKIPPAARAAAAMRRRGATKTYSRSSGEFDVSRQRQSGRAFHAAIRPHSHAGRHFAGGRHFRSDRQCHVRGRPGQDRSATDALGHLHRRGRGRFRPAPAGGFGHRQGHADPHQRLSAVRAVAVPGQAGPDGGRIAAAGARSRLGPGVPGIRPLLRHHGHRPAAGAAAGHQA